jgi:hypothetical protein
MNDEIIQSVAYDNHDDFQHINAMFSQIFIPLFLGLFNDKTDLRVRYYFSRENENSYHQHSNSCSLVFFYLS